MVKTLVLHALMSKAPTIVLWGILILFGIDFFIPDPLPFLDELVLGWLSMASIVELRRRGKLEEPTVEILPEVGGKPKLKVVKN